VCISSSAHWADREGNWESCCGSCRDPSSGYFRSVLGRAPLQISVSTSRNMAFFAIYMSHWLWCSFTADAHHCAGPSGRAVLKRSSIRIMGSDPLEAWMLEALRWADPPSKDSYQTAKKYCAVTTANTNYIAHVLQLFSL
jgi:hypothetical protein